MISTGIAEQEERLLACVHCGFCLPHCPTYRVLGDEADSPRGRLHLMRAVAEGRLQVDDPSFRTHIDRCLGCRACEPICPAGVPYGHLLELAREEIGHARGQGLLTRLLVAAFSARWANRFVGMKGRALRGLGIPRALARGLPAGGVAGSVRLGMAMLAASAPWRGLRGAVGDASAAAPAPGGRGRVGILRGCVQQALFGRIGEATRRTLALNGYDVVDVHDAGCCGALAAHAGSLSAAREAARRQIAAFEEAGVDWVAVDAAGCGAAMKGYAQLLESDVEWRVRAETLSARVRDVSQLLSMAGPRRGGPVEIRAAYDAPCHLLHGQGVSTEVADLLGAIPGLEVLAVPNADRCCGGAGIYGLTHPELGEQISREKIEAVSATGAEVVCTGNVGCMMQIGGGLLLAGVEMGVVHPVELLDESYRRAGFYERGVSGPGAGHSRGD